MTSIFAFSPLAADLDVLGANSNGHPVAILDLQFRPQRYHLAVGQFGCNLLAFRATTAGRKFMPGEPMNPATNRLAG